MSYKSKGVSELLDMVGYYRKFINRFADAARPMTKLTRKDNKFEWSNGAQSWFEYLKTCLAESPILKYPNPQKRYVVFTDASDQAAAAVPIQEYKDDDMIRDAYCLPFYTVFRHTIQVEHCCKRRLCNLLCH